MSYSSDEIFVREQALIGEQGLVKLTAAKIAICGLGGVGSYLAEALARAAIGSLVLIDFDQVAVSNINRQLCALHSTIGQDKADVIAQRIADINPACRVQISKQFIDVNTDFAALFKGCDYIGDAIDYVPGKLALIEYAYQQGVPLISAMGAGRRLDPTKFEIADISQTHGCPLAKNMRKQLKERGITKGVKVVFSTEQPLPAAGDAIGSISFVPSVAGLMMAGAIIADVLQR